MGILSRIINDEPGIFETLFNYENTGQWGEYLSDRLLTHNNLDGYLKTTKNVFLKTRNGTTEVDIIMLHEKGIFVFESKNYSGLIFGSEEQVNWTQCLYNKEKKKFYNPIMQNKTHINALARHLKLDGKCMFSFIIFSERCELKKVPESTDNVIIVKRDELLKSLRKKLDRLENRYSREQVDHMFLMLQQTDDDKEYLKGKHINQIEKVKGNIICPYCKSELVLRKGKYGDFYGCTKYPSCKYTKKLPD